jgi:hypothetical protein
MVHFTFFTSIFLFIFSLSYISFHSALSLSQINVGIDRYPRIFCYGRGQDVLRVPVVIVVTSSVVDPELFFPDPDPTLTLIPDSDPASNPDQACLRKIH